MGALPQDTTDGTDTQDERLLEAPRRRARKVGALLVRVVAVVVAAVFAWKISKLR